MKRSLVLIAFMLLTLIAASAVSAQQEAPVYEIDPSHTRVTFFVDHLGFSKMPGFFTDITGTIRFDPNDASQSRIDVRINSNSVNMGHNLLNAKLRGVDFFNTDKYPTIRFQGTQIEKTGMEDGRLTGNVTMLGITRPVTLEARFVRKSWNSYMNTETLGFSARGKISRSDFGMTKLLPDVGDEVNLIISVEAYMPTLETRQKRATEAAAKRTAIAKRKAAIEAEKQAQEKEAEAASQKAATAPVTPAAPLAPVGNQPVQLQLPTSFSGGGMSIGKNVGFPAVAPPGGGHKQ